MRVLIVEDERELLQMLATVLREADYAVDSAADGETGLYHALNFDYAAIILDVMLPKLNGWDLLGQLREKKNTPVLMLTARDHVRDRVRGLDTGADDYLVKPFQFDELMARLRAIIRRHANKAHNVFQIGGVKIDTTMRRVSLKGRHIELTPREYRVLEFLALHRGKVVTRRELFKHLSDAAEETGSNLLDVHVSNIRKKLGSGLISTRRGHGYCIE
jgi:two-component system OmpR family response regulator